MCAGGQAVHVYGVHGEECVQRAGDLSPQPGPVKATDWWLGTPNLNDFATEAE